MLCLDVRKWLSVRVLIVYLMDFTATGKSLPPHSDAVPVNFRFGAGIISKLFAM